MGSFFCGEEVKPRQFFEIVLWIQKQQSNYELSCLNDRFKIIKRNSIKEGISFLEQYGLFWSIKVICQGSSSADFLQELEKKNYAHLVEGVYIFCFDKSTHSLLLSETIVKCVENDILPLIECMSQKLDACQLPYVRRLSDATSKPIILQYSYMMAAMLNEVKDTQTRASLTKIFVQANNKYMDDKIYSLDYPKQLNHQKIVSLYCGKPIYRYVNKVMKSMTLNHLEKAEILISDLSQIINHHSTLQQRSNIKQSVFYQAVYVGQEEIQTFASSGNSGLEFMGFISTFKNQSQAKQLINKSNQKNNMLLTIYIPEFFRSEQSKNITGGYIDLQNGSLYAQQGDKVLFNIKSVMRLLRVQKNQRRKNIELIYGLDQMIKYVKEFGQIFVYNNNKKLRKVINQPCESCKQKKHLIGTTSKKLICLKYLNKQDIKESYLYINYGFCNFIEPTNKLLSMEIKYSPEAEKKMQQNHSQQLNTLCKTCRKNMKCSECVKTFCLCQLQQHDALHFQKSLMLIQGQVPRFISIPNQRQSLKMYHHYEQCNKFIKNKDNALHMAKKTFQHVQLQHNI